MRLLRLFIVFIACCTVTGFLSLKFCQAQDENDLSLVKRYAENSFRDKDYDFALENYLKLYETDKTNLEYNLRIGICYVETNVNKPAAIPFLEYVISRANFQKLAYYYLGRAYMYAYRFTEAVEAFYEYKISGINDEIMEQVNRMIDMAYYAQEAMNVPQNVTFERLDSTVNSPYDDYFPFVTADGSTLLYTSNRKYVQDLETYISNVYMSKDKKGVWDKSVELELNNYDNEEIVGMTPDGITFLMHSNGDYTSHDIVMAWKKGNKYIRETKDKLPRSLNTEGVEYGACLSQDGQTLYFASDRKGGRGGLDLYMVKRKVDGTWGEPENLGTEINTPYDENFPYLTPDGKTLIFASKGHQGFGGYDLFRTNMTDAGTWATPRNLQTPINTPYDNTTISFTADQKTAYIAANRVEGFGNLDIYKITFGDENVQGAIISGTVFVGKPGSAVPYSDDFLKVLVSVYDKFGNVYLRQSVEDDGTFFVTLVPGQYKMVVKFEGAKDQYEEMITIRPSDANEAIIKEVYLQSTE